MSEALIPPTYAEAAQLHRHFRQMFGSAIALDYLLGTTPTPTGAQLQAWLATPANLQALRQLALTQVGAAALCASTDVMAAVAASTTAMQCLVESAAALAVLVDSKTAMAAVAASAGAMGVLLASTAARTAAYDRPTAWAEIVASAVARDALNGVAAEANTSSTTHLLVPGVTSATRTVLVKQRCALGNGCAAGSGTDTYSTLSTVFVDRYARVIGLTHKVTNVSETSVVRYVVMQ